MWRQCALHKGTLAPPREYDSTYASFSPPESTTQTANRSVQPFLHRSRRSVVSHIGATCRIRLNIRRHLANTIKHVLRWSQRNPNDKSIGWAAFAQLAASPYRPTLQWASLSPKLSLPIVGSGPPYNSWFPGPARAQNPNGISIGALVFAGLTSVSDRQTDRPRYWVGNNRPHLRT